MTIDKKREIIEEAFNYYHDRTALNNKEEKELLNFVNELYEAISVTRCCVTLKIKELMIKLYNNNQLFIHSGDNINDYIDRAFNNAINKGQ